MRRQAAAKSRYQPSNEERAFMARRLLPFLSPDVGRYSIEHLMMEAYVQGLRDADEVYERRGPKQAVAPGHNGGSEQ